MSWLRLANCSFHSEDFGVGDVQFHYRSSQDTTIVWTIATDNGRYEVLADSPLHQAINHFNEQSYLYYRGLHEFEVYAPDIEAGIEARFRLEVGPFARYDIIERKVADLTTYLLVSNYGEF